MIAAWRLLRLGLGGLLIGGAALSLALALGLADPPRYGRLYAQAEGLDIAVALPAPPFTLIVEATWRADASPLHTWQLVFADATGAPQFALSVHGDASFALAPPQADSLGFIHLRRPPESNEIWLHLSPTEATLRLNRELAWRGALPAAARAQLIAADALQSAALRLYVP